MFKTGKWYQTNGINNKIIESKNFTKFVLESVMRYQNGDWGDLDDSDKKMNDMAVKNGDDRILARYVFEGEPIYIITEWDRSATTILFASEY